MRRQDKRKNMEQANLMLENSYLKSKGLINENVFNKARQAWEKGKKAWQNWREKRKQERKESKHQRVWYYWRDAIASYAGDVYDIPAFNYGGGESISDEPLIFEFSLFTYDENDARAGTRTFRYTMPEDWETNEDSEVTDGEIEEVTETIKESRYKKNMKKILRENIKIGDRVFAPRDEYYVTVLDIRDDKVLVDGPFGKEYHNLNDLEKLGGSYDE